MITFAICVFAICILFVLGLLLPLWIELILIGLGIYAIYRVVKYILGRWTK